MVTFTINVPWLLIVPAYTSSLIVLSTGIDSPEIIDRSIVLIPFIIIPSAGTISPGRIFIMLFSFKFNAFIFSSLFLLIIVAVVGCNSISFSIRYCVVDTVISSSNPPISIITAISPAANISPVKIDAIIAIDTNMSALMSCSYIRDNIELYIIGIAHSNRAIQDRSMLYIFIFMKLSINAIAEIVILVISYLYSFIFSFIFSPIKFNYCNVVVSIISQDLFNLF